MRMLYAYFRRCKQVLRDDTENVSFFKLYKLSLCFRNIKRCKLFRRTWFDGIDAIVPFVQCIVGVSPECQKIEISIDIDSIYIAYVSYFYFDLIFSPKICRI
jgi:hypothetical protein